MKQKSLSEFARIAVTAAIYVALTLLIAPLSYGAVQLRFAEVMTLLCFFRRDYCYALILGCAISNLFSPLGVLDLSFCVLSTVFSVVGIRLCKRLWTASLLPTLSMVFIAWEFAITGASFWFTFLTAAMGEFAVVTVLGLPLMALLQKNRFFMEHILKTDRKPRN